MLWLPEPASLLIGAKEAVFDEAQMQADRESKPLPPAQAIEPPAPNALIIDAPIRSGQSVYHPDGDVIVLGSVGSGSEIFAGGSVHVYGTLRGRAFAGATGKWRCAHLLPQERGRAAGGGRLVSHRRGHGTVRARRADAGLSRQTA